MKILITGVAGFIGFHVASRLCQQGYDVIGLDNINTYYDVNLKLARLKQLAPYQNFQFFKLDLTDQPAIMTLFKNENFDRVIHLAAQAGIRYSAENPMTYAESNLIGHLSILEACRENNIAHLVYASSSSVYGLSSQVPFSTAKSNTDHPISFYAATKKSNELMCHSYSNLYNIPTTGLRFFTVYGPWGRPDMALFKFTKSIINGEPIDLYNNGNMLRDFTYIDDVVEAIIRITNIIPQENKSWTAETGALGESTCPYRIYNVGHGEPIKLASFIKTIETSLGLTAKKNYLPMQPGDIYQTYSEIDELYNVCGFKPKVSYQQGVASFIKWYKNFYIND